MIFERKTRIRPDYILYINKHQRNSSILRGIQTGSGLFHKVDPDPQR